MIESSFQQVPNHEFQPDSRQACTPHHELNVRISVSAFRSMPPKERKIQTPNRLEPLDIRESGEEVSKVHDMLGVQEAEFCVADEPQPDVDTRGLVDAAECWEEIRVACVGAVDGVCGAEGQVAGEWGAEEGCVLVDVFAEFEGESGEEDGSAGSGRRGV